MGMYVFVCVCMHAYVLDKLILGYFNSPNTKVQWKKQNFKCVGKEGSSVKQQSLKIIQVEKLYMKSKSQKYFKISIVPASQT